MASSSNLSLVLDGFEAIAGATLPPGLLSLTGAQRSMVAAVLEKWMMSKLTIWSYASVTAAALPRKVNFTRRTERR